MEILIPFSVSAEEQNQRSRLIFDVLADATAAEEGGLLGLLGAPQLHVLPHAPKGLKGFPHVHVEKQVVLAKAVPWLRTQEDVSVLCELWSVLGLRGPLPGDSDVALKAVNAKLVSMDVDGTGKLAFELWNRVLTRQRSVALDRSPLVTSAASNRSGQRQGGKGGGGGGRGGEDAAAATSKSIVGINPKEVRDDARVLIVRLKELRDLMLDPKHPEKGIDPYLKLSLVCGKTEARHGKQMKQSLPAGESVFLVYDPPEYMGFVTDTDVSKTKLIATLMAKGGILQEDVVVGSAAVHLKRLSNAKLPKGGGRGGPSGKTAQKAAAAAASSKTRPRGGSSGSVGSSFGGGSDLELLKEEDMVLPLYSVETGDRLKTALVVGLRLVPKAWGFGFAVEQVYEYQRWRPECIDNVWGSDEDHLMLADPGKWSDETGAFFWSLDEASRPLPPGWTAEPWRASSKFGDHGWQYATAFRVAKWSNEMGSFSYVRRRMWYRSLNGAHDGSA
jgi:hypothetical protein